jgi:hypothetical protein
MKNVNAGQFFGVADLEALRWSYPIRYSPVKVVVMYQPVFYQPARTMVPTSNPITLR